MYRVMCDNCHKKPAVRKVVTFNKEKKTVSYLCEDCYYKRQQKATISIMHGMAGAANHPVEQPGEDICRKCGTTAHEFLATGILGCENCYNDLATEILSMIQSSQVKTSHTGKSPLNMDHRTKRTPEKPDKQKKETKEPDQEENVVLKLKKQLESAILTEDFEQACVLRDKINTLEAEDGSDA